MSASAARPSRAEQQAATRAALLAAARARFLADGYQATSLERVAEDAGFSKGAVYSNFDGKDALCLAVVDDIRADQVEAIRRAMARGATWPDRVAALQAWAERTIGDASWLGLEVEFAAAVRHDPVLRGELVARQRATRELLAGVIAEQAAHFGLELRLPAEQVALALLSLGVGLGVQRATEPDLAVEVLGAALSVLVERPR